MDNGFIACSGAFTNTADLDDKKGLDWLYNLIVAVGQM